MSIEIREATSQDLSNGLAELFDSYRQFYRQTSDVQSAKNFLNERISNKESIIYVAYETTTSTTTTNQNKLVGFTQLYPLFSSVRMKRLWLLNDLFVSETFRGKGISRKLIVRAKQLCRETKAAGVSLQTEKTNMIGNKLYVSEEFELDSEHNYYEWTSK